MLATPLMSNGWAIASAVFFFSSRRRHTRLVSDWSSDVCSSDLVRLRHPPPTHGASWRSLAHRRPPGHRTGASVWEDALNHHLKATCGHETTGRIKGIPGAFGVTQRKALKPLPFPSALGGAVVKPDVTGGR